MEGQGRGVEGFLVMWLVEKRGHVSGGIMAASWAAWQAWLHRVA